METDDTSLWGINGLVARFILLGAAFLDFILTLRWLSDFAWFSSHDDTVISTLFAASWSDSTLTPFCHLFLTRLALLWSICIPRHLRKVFICSASASSCRLSEKLKNTKKRGKNAPRGDIGTPQPKQFTIPCQSSGWTSCHTSQAHRVFWSPALVAGDAVTTITNS
jgi:hypothetical protein